MALLTKRGAGTPVTTLTTWATTTNAVDGTPPANPATYATWTSTVTGAVATIEITGYDFSTVTGTLNSVSVSIRHLVNTIARYSTIRYQPYSGGVALGSIATATITTAAHNDSATFPVTLAELQAADFKVRVTITRAATTQSGVFSLDHADVTADYTPPGVARTLDARTPAASSATATTVLRSRAFRGAGSVGGGFVRGVERGSGTSPGRVPCCPGRGRAIPVRGGHTGPDNNHPHPHRAGTATGARGSLVTAGPAVVTLTGRAASASGARAALSTVGPTFVTFTGRAATAAGTRSGVLVSRPFVARAPTVSDARAVLLVTGAVAPPGILATARLQIADVLAGIDPTSTGDVFGLFRGRVTDALTGATVENDVFATLREVVTMTLDLETAWEVHAGPVDSLTPPAFMLQWADPWTTRSTMCHETARLEIVCIGPCIEPDMGTETLELMVEAALAALSRAGISHGETSAPRPFDIGGLPYLAARISLEMTVPIGG